MIRINLMYFVNCKRILPQYKLKLRSLRFHSPRLCRIAVLLIQTNVSRSDSRFSTQANVPIKTVPPPLGGHSDTAHAGLAQHRRQPRAGRHCVLRWRLMFITYYIRMSLRHRTSWLRPTQTTAAGRPSPCATLEVDVYYILYKEVTPTPHTLA